MDQWWTNETNDVAVHFDFGDFCQGIHLPVGSSPKSQLPKKFFGGRVKFLRKHPEMVVLQNVVDSISTASQSEFYLWSFFFLDCSRLIWT